ncbi:MAG TPA: universal stress protein [Flavipsychrobacter sp.]|nr:universal stress protein [Flavipsychrobacter sp.]
MEKIVVTTDLSANSRAAMRFAIQLAAQCNAQVVFLHVHQVLRTSFWSDELYAQYIAHHKENVLEELQPIVRSVCRSMNRTPFHFEIAVHHNLDVTDGILEYAADCDASCICISTRGAGNIRKLFGTYTAALLERSKHAVVCVPARQRIYPVAHIMYASDMKDYMYELLEVVNFTRPLQAKLTLFHIAYDYEFRPELSVMEAQLKKQLDYPVRVTYCERDTNHSLTEDIEAQLKPVRQAVLVLFSEQRKGMVEKLLVPGSARELSFHARQVFISFPKRHVTQQKLTRKRN